MASHIADPENPADRRAIEAHAADPDTPTPTADDFPNVGVQPMAPPPGQPEYMRHAQPVGQPDYMRNALPVGKPPDPDVIAHAAADNPDTAAKTLDASDKTGLALGYIAGGLDESIKAIDRQKFAAQLTGRPILSSWAGQSPQHAALVRKDAAALGQTEGWFSGWGDAIHAGLLDVAYAESMRERQAFAVAQSRSPEYIDAKVQEFAAGGRDPRDVAAFRRSLENPTPGPFAAGALDLEDAARTYDSTPHGYAQQIMRAVPQMAMYGATEVLSGPAGVAGLLYAQNKGVLARQIELAQPGPPSADTKLQMVRGKDGGLHLTRVEPEPTDDNLTPEEIDKYATAGSAVGAVALAGFLGPMLRSFPGVKQALGTAVGEAFARTSVNTLGRAAIRNLLTYGKHSFLGALGMALQHSINEATVQKAAGEDLDFGQLGRDTANTFVKVLPVAMTFAAYGPTREFLADRGRLKLAPAERAQLDAQVKLAQEMQLTKTAPQRAAELFGLMGRGAKVFIGWEAAKKMTGLPPDAVAQAEVAQDSVAVPAGDYLAHLSDQHEAIKDDVKLSADGLTMNEARARDKELRGTLPEDVANALLGKQTPDDVLQFEQPAPEKTEAPPAKAAEGKVAETVKLFRGALGQDPSLPGRAGARFLSPDRKVAEGYASPENSMNAGKTGEGKVSEETLHFENVLKADSLDAVKEALGFEKGKPVGTEEVLNKARDVGHDAVSYKTKEMGTVYVDLMNWLHDLVKQYGGTVEKWQERLTPELLAALKDEGAKGATAPEEHAARVVEALPSGDIDPARFERLAKKAQKYIQEAAEKARSGSAAGAKASSARDVAILSTYETARDVNLAKAKKATEVVAEMDKIAEGFTKAAKDDKLRGLLGKAGAPLLHLFDVLTESTGTADPKTALNQNRKGWMAAHQDAVAQGAEPFSEDAIGYANDQMRRSLDEAQQWFKDAARPPINNEQVIRKFLASPKSIGELRPAEVRIISDAVNQLTKTAREENIVRVKDSKATVEEVSVEIIGELRQNPSKGLPQPSGTLVPWFKKMLLDANAANAVQLRPKNNLREKSIAAVKWIFNRINDAVYARDGLMRDVGEKWGAAFDAMPKDIAARRYETYDISDKLPTPGMEPLDNVPRQWLWKMARHRMSAGNMERVLSTSGWDAKDIDHILFDDPKTKLTVPEWDYLQSLADVNEQYVWPKLKSHFEEHYGVAPPKTAAVPFKVELPDGTFKDYAGGYEPLKRDARPGTAPQPEPTKGIAQYWGKDFQIPWTPGSAKERVDNSHYLVNMDWDSSRVSMSQTLHWLAFDQPVRDVAKLLNDQGLSAAMNEYMGEGRADATRGWLKSSATRQSQSIPEGMEIVASAFGWQRRLALMGIVGGSARLATAQLSHPLGLMLRGKVNPIHGFPAFFSTFKPMTMADGEVRLFPNWNDAINYGEEVQHRADNAYGSLRQSWDKSGPAPGPLGTLKSVALRTAGLWLHAVDRLTTSWAWTAFHNEAVAKGMEPFSREAIDYANGNTQDVMPVHDIETAAPILTNRQVGGFLIMHGFKNTLYNFRQDDIAASVMDFHQAQGAAAVGSAIAKTAGRVALGAAMFGGFSIMGKFALGYGQQEDESKGAWLARDFLGGQFADIPIIGGLAEPMAKWMLGGQVSRRDFTMYSNPGMAAVNKVYDTLGNLVNGGREDYKKVFDLLEASLFLSGVPSRPVRNGAEHVYEMLMGEGYDEGGSDTGGRFFYTDKQWASIKRSLTPDED